MWCRDMDDDYVISNGFPLSWRELRFDTVNNSEEDKHMKRDGPNRKIAYFFYIKVFFPDVANTYWTIILKDKLREDYEHQERS